MDTKTLHVLEYPKILERLVTFCDFSASMELARRLEPTDSYDLAIARLSETSEARKLFSTNDNIGIGGAHDIRPAADLAAHSYSVHENFSVFRYRAQERIAFGGELHSVLERHSIPRWLLTLQDCRGDCGQCHEGRSARDPEKLAGILRCALMW